jgi:subtilase family serine protease
MRTSKRWLVALTGPVILLGITVPSLAAQGSSPALPSLGSLIRTANVLPGLAHAIAHGVAAPTTELTVDIGLSNPNQSELNTVLADIYNPSSPDYHQFLTPAEYNAHFGISTATIRLAKEWLHESGLTASYVSGSGALIAVQGTVAQLGSLFHTTFGNYSIGKYSFVANESQPSVPSSLPISDVVGLNTLQRVWTEGQIGGAPLSGTAQAKTAASGYVGTLVPQDLWGVDSAPAADEGQGETAGMFGYGYSNGVVADLRVYEQRDSLPPVPVRVVNESAVTTPSVQSDNDILGEDEWNLDTQAVSGMAPKLSQLDMYFSSTPLDADTAVMFSDWANDPNGPKQMDASFGECEADPTSPYDGALPPLQVGQGAIGNQMQLLADASLRQAVLEGRTLFTSAGDTAGSCPAVILPVLSAGNGVIPQPLPFDQNYPCVSAYAVCVGGTVVTTNGTSNPALAGATSTDATTTPKRVDEQSWIFTGGGPAANVPRPAYQEGVAAIKEPCTELSQPKGGSIPLGTVCRGVPDVAAMSGTGLVDGELEGSNAYLTNIDMMPTGSGGTSLSSPLSVGMWARIQAASPATAKGVYGGLGFANETFYAVGKGKLGNYAKDFYDVTSAELPIGNFYQQPAKGWDYTSGWGAINVTGFIQDVDHDLSLTPTHAATPVANSSYFPVPVCSASMTSAVGNAYDSTLSLFYPFMNDPSLDITSATLAPNVAGTALVATISGPALSTTGPIDALDGFNFYLAWTYGGKTYFAGAEIDPGQQLPATPLTNSIPAPVSLPTGTVVYGDGLLDSDSPTFINKDVGTFTGHTITITIPLAHVGAPAAGSLLLYPYAFDTLPIAILVPFATDEAVATAPGQALELGPHC